MQDWPMWLRVVAVLATALVIIYLGGCWLVASLTTQCPGCRRHRALPHSISGSGWTRERVGCPRCDKVYSRVITIENIDPWSVDNQFGDYREFVDYLLHNPTIS